VFGISLTKKEKIELPKMSKKKGYYEITLILLCSGGYGGFGEKGVDRYKTHKKKKGAVLGDHSPLLGGGGPYFKGGEQHSHHLHQKTATEKEQGGKKEGTVLTHMYKGEKIKLLLALRESAFIPKGEWKEKLGFRREKKRGVF